MYEKETNGKLEEGVIYLAYTNELKWLVQEGLYLIKKKAKKDYYEDLIAKLSKAGAKKIVLTGVSFSPDKLGVAVWDGEKIEYHFEDFINRRSHGTGDIYASAFTGAYEKGESLLSAAAFAAKFVVKCITETKDFSEHFYGVRFEKALGLITDKFLK